MICCDQIGLHAQNILTILSVIVNTIGKAQLVIFDHFQLLHMNSNHECWYKQSMRLIAIIEWMRNTPNPSTTKNVSEVCNAQVSIYVWNKHLYLSGGLVIRCGSKENRSKYNCT